MIEYVELSDINEKYQKVACLFLPHLSVVSESNICQHWTKKRKRRIVQDQIIRWEWKIANFHHNIIVNQPYTIVFTRLSRRRMDDDNLVSAFKAIRDTIADLLIPGKAKGVADGDKRLKFIYNQHPGPKGIKIQIYKFREENER